MSFHTEPALGKQAETLTLALYPSTESLVDDYSLFKRKLWRDAACGMLIVNDVLPEALDRRGPDAFNRACLSWFSRNSSLIFVTTTPAPSNLAESVRRYNYSPKVAVVVTHADRAPSWVAFAFRARGRRTAIVGRFPPELGGVL